MIPIFAYKLSSVPCQPDARRKAQGSGAVWWSNMKTRVIIFLIIY